MKIIFKLSIAAIIVILGSLIFKFYNLPDSPGKYFAYFGIAVIPLSIMHYKDVKEKGCNLDYIEFTFLLIIGTQIILCFSFFVFLILKIIFSREFI